jgi:DNA polymerase III delta prime subunit
MMNVMMTLSDIEARWPLIGRFLSQAVRQQHVANTFVFLGDNPEAMMGVVQFLTAILNCADPTDAITACGTCQNCRWIASNAHPGFMTLSNWDADAGKVKQAIQVEQFNDLLSELSRHSGGFKRVVVLVGAQEGHVSEQSAKEAPLSQVYPVWMKEPYEAGKVRLAALDRKMFSDKVANKLLKTLEEPPRDTHFFIFTDSERKLLDTILSRAQILRFPPSAQVSTINHVVEPELEALFDWFFPKEALADKNLDPLTFPEKILAVAEATSQSSSSVLKALLALAHQRLPQQLASPEQFKRFSQRLNWLEQTRWQLDSHVKEDAALEGLGFEVLASAWGKS